GLPPAGGNGWRDHVGVHFAEVLKPAESLEDVLEGLETVAEASCLLVAEALGQVGEALVKAGQRPAGQEPLELFRRGARKCAGRERRLPPAADRAEPGRRLGDDELVAPAS